MWENKYHLCRQKHHAHIDVENEKLKQVVAEFLLNGGFSENYDCGVRLSSDLASLCELSANT